MRVMADTPKPKRATLRLDQVIPNPRNDNIHPPAQIKLLVENIRRFGQPKPILVRQANHMIIAGHGVHQAMREAGETSIDVFLWDVDQHTADGFLLADNRFSELSHRDADKRRDLLADFAPDDYAALGFGDDDIKSMIEGPAPLEIHEVETHDVTDTFWISVRGPLAQQAQALSRISEVMAELPGVDVDLGTIAS